MRLRAELEMKATKYEVRQCLMQIRWEYRTFLVFKSFFVALISYSALKRIKWYNFWKSSFPYKTTFSKKIPCLNEASGFDRIEMTEIDLVKWPNE